MNRYEDRLAVVEAEWRAKYTDKEREESAAKGHAMDGGSYIIEDQDDLEKAIKAVGRGNADHDSIRKHIITQAARLKLSSLIPDNWNSDGSLADEEQKAAAWDAEHREGTSYNNMREMLQNAVAAKYGGDGEKGWVYVLDFGEDWVVYEAYEGDDQRCTYSVDGNTVTLGDPEPVSAETTYEPLQTNAASVQADKRKAEVWDAEHRSGPSYKDRLYAISKAIRDLPDAGSLSAYLCDFDDDTATYESGCKLFQVPYKEQDDGSVELGDPQEVQPVTTYQPVERKSAETQAEERAVRRRKERRRAVPLGNEFRFRPLAETGIEVREQADTNELIVTGKPIKYGVPYLVRDAFGEFEETIHRGSVTDILNRVDCRFLVNHEGIPMARVRSDRSTRNTMRLWDEADDLNFEARLDARQQIANDFTIALERGDIDEMSIGMKVGRDKWGVSGGRETRDIFALDDLLDISGVTYACSPTTSIEVAQRMALEMPVESRARLRRMEVDLRAGRVSAEELAGVLAILQGDEERAGQMLSKASKGKLVEAAKSIHGLLEAAGYDPADLIDTDGGDESVSTETALTQDGTRSGEEGEPIRSVKAASLRLQLEARTRRGKRPKAAA